MGSEKRFLEKLQKKKKNKKKSGASLNTVDSPTVPENHGGGNGGKVISDPRFSSLHTDPRFREPPKRKTKVAIDSRFDRIFTDKSFLPSSAPVDKRGKVRQQNLQQSSLRHYYKMDENEKGGDKDEGSDEEGKEIESDGGTPVEEAFESQDEDGAYELESSTDTDGDVSADEEELPETQEEVPEIDKETHRLAVVNMDWRYVKAVDLYVLLSSFAPPYGQIRSVAVYPSEFGLQRMQEEEVHGPIGLFDGEAGDDEIDNEKLRAYEKSRMRYYYAVVECDSSTTADRIYRECDGLEFLQSSNALDLRFIPDSMEFNNPPRDVATEAPANYEGKDFYTRALQHSNVQLSWDEDEPLRAKTLRRKFNDEQLAELELTEFLASDGSESDGEGEQEDNVDEGEDHPDRKTLNLEKYRALLESGDGSDGDGEEDGQDMEVTFNTGLEDISKHILEKKDKKSETVWEAYLRKRREKKRARKSKSKHSSSDDDISDTDQDTTEQTDDFFMGEPPIKKRREEKSKKEQKHQIIDGADKATKEELELLLADDQGANNGLRGYNLKFKTAKGKRAKETIDEAKIPSADLDDPRFAALFTSRDYALDPTDPQFKRSAAYARQRAHKLQKGDIDILAEEERVKPSKGIEFSSNDAGVKKGEEEGSDVLQSNMGNHELSALVKSVKMKSKQVQLPSSDNKTKRDGKLLSGGLKKRKH